MSDPQLSSCHEPRFDGVGSRWAKALRLAALAGCLLIAGSAVRSADAAPTTMVDLGTASSYAVLSGASVANTASAPLAPHTMIRGDLGVTANAQPSGFPPEIVTGAVIVGNAAAAQAHSDLVSAYDDVAGRPGGAPLAAALAGAVISPGLHTIASAATIAGTVTLDAGDDPSGVFVFQVDGALDMAASSHVVLINGAQASRVFWQVNGAGSIGANAVFAGTLMALDAVSVGNGTLVNGRALARNGAVTLDADAFYSAPPVLGIAGGATAITADTTPTISGTTDVDAPAVVTVTINGQTLHATPSGGAWSVTSPTLANGTFPVVSSTSDGAGNPASATQQLTVDTALPVVALDGGSSVTTNDSTPTIAGTSDVAPGTAIRVTVDAQTLIALVQAGGRWNVTPDALSDGTRAVTASVTDPASNEGSDTQELTVDTTAPAATISGGANALTNDWMPNVSGTADVAPRTTVTVTLADETLSGVVQSDGTWSVTSGALSDGPYRVVMKASDAAGNAGTANQTLTVDSVSPAITITGGARATANDGSPTIAGTSDASAGMTVTVSIADRTMTTLLQANGTWNVTPADLAKGTWAVAASVPDPAGNVGRARQILTITARSSTPSDGSSFNAASGTKVTPSCRQKVKGSSLSIGTRVTAPGALVVATVNGLVRIAGLGKAITLTTVTAGVAAGRSVNLKLVPKGATREARSVFAKVRNAVRARRKVTATITVKIIDGAGHTRTVTRTVKLT
jgi:Ice-binding-like/Bacterial Ig-like domain